MSSADILRAAHSPLPWQVERSKGSNRVVKVGDCLGDRVVLAGFASAVGSVSDEPSQTTDFIVRACNAHYGLLDAAKGLRQHLALFCGPDDAIANAVFAIADAAIAAAEAEAGR